MESKNQGDDASEIKCYIHSVSPVKKSANTSYFNCNLQTESNVYRSVCFALEKKETLEAMAQQRSPVKIKKYAISSKYGREDVINNKYSTITATNADFEYKSEDVTSISFVTHVTPEQLVAIKGYLAYFSNTKKVIIKGSELKKQDGYISDPSGYIKIIFWGNHTGKVQQGSTYLFNKLTVKTNQNQKYLNTPRQESECTIELAEAFTENLPALDQVSTTKEITANILGISNINKYNSCCNCTKKVAIKGKLAFCENCKMSQKSSTCLVQWSLRLYVQNCAEPKQKLHLYVFGQHVVKKLFTMSGIHETSSEDVLETLLDVDTAKLSYDTQSNKVIDIDPIDI